MILATAPLSLAVPGTHHRPNRPAQPLAAPSRPSQSVADFYKMTQGPPLPFQPAWSGVR